MTSTLRKQDIQIAYSMIETAQRIRARRDGSHLFQLYFLFWAAFNKIYTAIAYRKGIRTQIKKNSDGSIMTITNGNVNIPKVLSVSEKEQIYCSLDEFKDVLKDSLIHHKGTEYFVNRIPYWQSKPIEYDVVGQRVNGVLNIEYTVDRQ
ncbi:MAG: hypothetical protein JXR87_08775, partial [Candidatus Marinimicrobia bacterium]|nr:hypothetical protein [Candidatus Neomarinimicrobiota bacterium]